ncbi:ABC-type transport system involved in multi-copper enzyme maturation, permease component [Methanocella conradii HZ254]|uniref:ABC-type transport system involved in multi-copper enzyme maturation, permease component n=1 Tax=Methanocella conradii (strain DSM 24694 / JCM 17849 / CGMCC 1.5162 / HZ254) TaxID=1041930 RepID=H8I477_METCZ|nr:ABC transporter permease subunit [Methanocella conradii]AFC99216.1 ABC-type transport system involved in multi-copper enzyme maturation, permease component [Methanocella conradii HZ254]
MANLLAIAKKEFVDLLSNHMVLIVIIAMLINIVGNAYDFYVVSSGWRPGARVMYDSNMGVAACNNVFFGITWFGTIIGIILGCSTISSERAGKALSTLTTKPVYRDTIINGKILGALAFLACVMMLFIAFHTSALLILCGSLLAPFLLDYFSRLLFVFLFSMAFVMAFLSLSMLISLLVSDQAFAMILSTLTVYISYEFTTLVSYNLDRILPGYGLGGMLARFSPYSMLWEGGVQDRFMNTGIGAWEAFMEILPDFTRLLLVVTIVLVLSYIVFVRRDIS